MISGGEMLVRLALAAILGGLVGLERERVESAAGLRTHAIVALGACLFMLVSMFGFSNAGKPPGAVLDPSRVAAQIVTGIGFLGAGVIIFRQEIIRGLTTAASVWLVAAIGMSVGGGLYIAAVGGTIFGLAILAIMKPLESRLFSQPRQHVVRLAIDRNVVSAEDIREELQRPDLQVIRFDIRYNADPSKTRVDVHLRPTRPETLAELFQTLADRPGVNEVRSTLNPYRR